MSATLKLSDGTAIAYSDAGEGQPVVFVPGWSQTAAMFSRQTEQLIEHRRVVSYDHRGHGASVGATHGFRVARLAADLHELLHAVTGEERVDVVAHSMGCSVIFSYWQLFGGRNINRIVFIDQPAALTAWRPAETSEQIGAPLDVPAAIEFAQTALADEADAIAAARAALEMMLTDKAPDTERDWMLRENLQLKREHAAALFLDQALGDWRDVIPTITAPSLVVGGEASFMPQRGIEWLAHTLPNARLRSFSAAERGSHFMYWENPDEFNRMLNSFLELPPGQSS